MRTARISAVISMRYEISDKVSIGFANVLYRELLTGQSPGRIDVAVQEARRALDINASGDAVRDFITPVLHLSPGRLASAGSATVPRPAHTGVGEKLVLKQNGFLARSFANGVQHGLAESDRAVYPAWGGG